MLADLILATIIERPGITTPELRAAFPNETPKRVLAAILLLRDEGFVETTARGTYRAVTCHELGQVTATPPRRCSTIAPAPMARLMAGR